MNFFKSLKKKTEKTPSIQVEEALFKKLDLEWSEHKSNPPVHSTLWEVFITALRPLPTVFAVLALAIGIGRIEPQGLKISGAENPILGLDRLESELILGSEDLEFYETLEDWMLTASDQEWKERMELRDDQNS